MTTVRKPGRNNGIPSQPPRVENGRIRAAFTSPITVLSIASLPQQETTIVGLSQELEKAGILRMTQTGFYNPIYPEIAPEQRILVAGGHLKVCLEGQLCSYVALAERGVRVEVLLPLDLIYREHDDFEPGKSSEALKAKLEYFQKEPSGFLSRLRQSPLSWLLLLDGEVIGSNTPTGKFRVDFCARVFSDSEKLREYLKITPF